jgi:hypothetical protein
MGKHTYLDGLTREELLEELKTAKDAFEYAKEKLEEDRIKAPQDKVDTRNDFDYYRDLIRDINKRLENDTVSKKM